MAAVESLERADAPTLAPLGVVPRRFPRLGAETATEESPSWILILSYWSGQIAKPEWSGDFGKDSLTFHHHLGWPTGGLVTIVCPDSFSSKMMRSSAINGTRPLSITEPAPHLASSMDGTPRFQLFFPAHVHPRNCSTDCGLNIKNHTQKTTEINKKNTINWKPHYEASQFTLEKFFGIPSRKLTYPTWGKGKSSSNMPYQGDEGWSHRPSQFSIPKFREFHPWAVFERGKKHMVPTGEMYSLSTCLFFCCYTVNLGLRPPLLWRYIYIYTIVVWYVYIYI